MSSLPTTAPSDAAQFIKNRVRTIDGWPQPGVQFRDITPVLADRRALRTLIDLFVQRYIDAKLDTIAGLDARGFIIGPILAYELSIGFVPIRKKGKLPYKTLSQSYELEYASATVEIHEDACQPGERVVIVDDLIATGGTMMAGTQLLRRLGAVVVEGAAIIDLPDLGGSKLLRNSGLPLFTVCEFADR
ncbi:adenine phosphoribosyltransferase [Caballeronia humi]|uniref:Adenine phosphoribosyltransferase n=1 Tax=Caballeronia humi TaxID=326474 RepID=A0A158F0M6_9BURK|nr:adenine phosphoribosyltransferase [Caballeronia humi]SAL13394.1 adenine phosphoribosyltransferase [Caballeronia humi]